MTIVLQQKVNSGDRCYQGKDKIQNIFHSCQIKKIEDFSPLGERGLVERCYTVGPRVLRKMHDRRIQVDLLTLANIDISKIFKNISENK